MHLMRVLAQLAVGDEIRYAVLSEKIGRDVQGEARHCLDTARRRLLRDERRVFDVVRDIGLRRLNDCEIVRTADRARAHIRRTARKAARTVLCADYAALDRETQVRHNVALSVLAVTEIMAGEKAAKRIGKEVDRSGHELSSTLTAALALKDVS
ncbi:hypothetical protein AB3X94_37100 [Paraburkholderia sp. BR10923]|uniref:hypothetical protein n=1 Tax=Paraburkholderia sp. BR10923 TaxID=3236992 RepID=UPI0034CE6493